MSIAELSPSSPLQEPQEDIRPEFPGVIIFDIETGPLPEEDLRRIFEPTDPDKVPLGNRSKPDVVAAYIEQYLAEEFTKFVEKAALDPLTGRVLAIGWTADDGFESMDGDGHERLVLSDFWTLYESCEERSLSLVGFNIFGFDLPFLVNRSRILGVDVPPSVVNGRFFSRVFIDLLKVWNFDSYSNYVSLNKLCKALGLGEKNGDGADFARLWEEDREQAIAYLRQDLALTTKLANRLKIGAPVA